MKTTTFDQLKSMLKSMSLSIFPRLRNMEKNIDEIKATIPAPEKEIIFTKGADGQYTCNIPHAELWEMDADIIGKNARIIDNGKEYGVRGASKKTESLYGNVIQVYADLNVGKYDLPALYHKTLIITYCTPEILGNASAIYGEKVYSLSDARNDNATPDIPVLDGGGWMNRSIDFMEYDDLHGKYVLKTMSETAKGGAMVGKGLKMDGDALNVDEGEYELIETILLKEDTNSIERTEEPDGTAYAFVALDIRAMVEPASAQQFTQTRWYTQNGSNVTIYNASGIRTTKSLWHASAYPEHGRMNGRCTAPVSESGSSPGGWLIPTFGYFFGVAGNISRVLIQSGAAYPVGTKFEIWAVRP